MHIHQICMAALTQMQRPLACCAHEGPERSGLFIVNGGIPRSGTVLVGEIIRALLQSRGHHMERYNPQERRHLTEFAEVIASTPPQATMLVHTHLIDRTCLDLLARRKDAFVFWNHRDPRDALVSLIRLHDLPLARALHSLEVYLAAADLPRHWGKAYGIRYERLVTNVPAHIRRIAGALGLEADQEEVERIRMATSPEAHSKIMHEVRDTGRADTRQIKTLFREMREDPDTLINDRHLQSGRSGRWKTELTPEAQKIATARLRPWIDAYAYDL